MGNREPWSWCETPEEKCTMNYCDENGCQNRKRVLVGESHLRIIPKDADVEYCQLCSFDYDIKDMKRQQDSIWICNKCLSNISESKSTN
jgi:ribosomal protein L37AE/L43A